MATVYKREGSAIYQARIKVGDRLIRISTGKRNAREALKEADRIEAERNKALLTADDMFLLAASDRFFSEKTRLAVNTVSSYKYSLANILEILGDFPLRLLSQKDIGRYVNQRKTRSGPVATRRDLAFLSSLYTTARHWDCGVNENPVKGYDRRGIPEAKSHNRWLRQKEYELLLAACEQDNHRRFLVLAVNTGMRHQELLKLHWNEVDLKDRLINLPEDRAKNQEARTIPLTKEALDTLRSTPEEERTGWVFPGRIDGKPMNNLGKGWRTIRTRANVKVRIHDLRHTFASWLAQRGVSEKAAQDLMGHKTSNMTKRYTHLSVGALQSAIATLDRGTVRDTVQVGEQMTE